MVVVALIALVQLAVLVMLLAAITITSGSSEVDPVQEPKRQINRLEQLTIEAMMAETARSGREYDGWGS